LRSFFIFLIFLWFVRSTVAVQTKLQSLRTLQPMQNPKAKGREEPPAEWRIWNALQDPYDQIDSYYPGRFLHPSERKQYEFTERTRIALFGLRGNGKSAFIDSTEYVLSCKRIFKRQGNSPNSFTPHAQGRERVGESVRLGPHLEMLDSEGLPNFAEGEMKAILKDLKYDQLTVFEEIANVFQKLTVGKTIHLDIHAAIIVWKGTLEIQEISSRLSKLIATLRKFFGRNPIVLVTHKDQLAEPQAQQILAELEKVQASPYFIANFTKPGQENEETKGTVLTVLLDALNQADSNSRDLQIQKESVCVLL